MCPVASEGTKGCGSHEGSLQSANPCWTPTCAHVHVHVHVHMHVRPCSYTFTCPCLVGRLEDGFSEASQACSPRSNRSMWHIRSAMHTRHEHGHEGLRLEPLRLDLSLHAIGLALNLQAMNSPMLSTAAPQAPLPRTGSKQIHLRRSASDASRAHAAVKCTPCTQAPRPTVVAFTSLCSELSTSVAGAPAVTCCITADLSTCSPPA